MKDIRIRISKSGECWLIIKTPNGKSAMISLGQRGGEEDNTIVGQTLREVAEKE